MHKTVSRDNRMRKDSNFKSMLKRLCHNRLAVIGMIIIVILAIVAVFGELIAPYDYKEIDILNAYKKPCAEYFFGTDSLGRDLFSRVLVGAKYSLSLGICAQILKLVAGIILGCIAGYYGGQVDNWIMRFCDVWQSIPGLLMTVLLCSVLGNGWINTVLAMGIGGIPGTCRQMRGQLLSIRQKLYIEAAHSIDLSPLRIVLKYMIPNSLAPIIVSTAMGIGNTIGAAAGLSYLGLGVQPPTPEWGAMITAGRNYITTYPHLMIFPGLALALTILAMNLFGDGLRDAMDPRMKK